MKKRRLRMLVFGALAAALAEHTFAEADPSTTDASKQTSPTQIQRDLETQAVMAQAIEKMKTRDADQAAAQLGYTQSVETAKAEHRDALDNCQSLVGEAQKSCKQRADTDLAAAKSKADSALKAHTSVQP